MAGGIHSLESIPGPHKHLKVRAQARQATHRLAESIPGLFKRLQMQALEIDNTDIEQLITTSDKINFTSVRNA